MGILVPLSAFAAGFDLGYVNSVFAEITTLVNTLVPLLLALALLLFIWGVIQYFILGADEEAKRETGRVYMIYALLGLVAIVAVWGLVALALQIFGLEGTHTPPPLPGLPSV